MAEIKDRKRNRTSLDEDPSITLDQSATDKSIDTEKDVCEPVSKHARKSTSPEPNNLPEISNISNTTTNPPEQVQTDRLDQSVSNKSINIKKDVCEEPVSNKSTSPEPNVENVHESINIIETNEKVLSNLETPQTVVDVQSELSIIVDQSVSNKTIQENVCEPVDKHTRKSASPEPKKEILSENSNTCSNVDGEIQMKPIEINIERQKTPTTISTPDVSQEPTKEILSENSNTSSNVDGEIQVKPIEINIEGQKTPTTISTPDASQDVTKEIDENNDHNNVVEGNIQKDSKPIITISFLNEGIMSKYRQKFTEFISKFVEFESSGVDNVIKVMLRDDTIANDRNKKYRKKNKRAKKEKELFVLDNTPTSISGNEKLQYSSKFKVIEDLPVGEAIEDENKCAKLSMCFNCDGNHNLQNCPDRKDFNKIRAARQKFQSSRPPQSVRYHVEETQKYDGLKPGQLTENLRCALGITSNEVPEYIYRMRQLGYPPGWLEDAQEVESNLSIYGIDEKDVKDKLKIPHVNPDKIIDYPGFNVELGNDCRDQYNLYGCPPYSVAYSKDAMIKFINSQQENMVKDNPEIYKMQDKSKEVKVKSDSALEEPSIERRISPSLIDLESKKEEILAALDDSNSDVTIVVNEESKDVGTPIMENVESPLITTPTSNRIVKMSSFGTPILKSGSPFSRLPNPDNFMKGVSAVIDYENLPNSTGKYDQLTCVLDKVRKSLKDIQEKPV